MLNLKGGLAFKIKKAPRKHIIDLLSGVKMIILDEISMMSRQIIGALDFASRNARIEVRKPFGGIMMIFCDDVFKIPPETADPVYIPFQNSEEGFVNVSQRQKDASSLEHR